MVLAIIVMFLVLYPILHATDLNKGKRHWHRTIIDTSLKSIPTPHFDQLFDADATPTPKRQFGSNICLVVSQGEFGFFFPFFSFLWNSFIEMEGRQASAKAHEAVDHLVSILSSREEISQSGIASFFLWIWVSWTRWIEFRPWHACVWFWGGCFKDGPSCIGYTRSVLSLALLCSKTVVWRSFFYRV